MRKFLIKKYFFLLISILHSDIAFSQKTIREDILLCNDWYTIADQSKDAYYGFETSDFMVKGWAITDIPHNWDQYAGYRRMLHGNFHGYAWYRKEFSVHSNGHYKRYFLFFEGVGSYATVWLNGIKVGFHAGGRTSFTIDITDAIRLGEQQNLLAVRADHPPFINDLPWVCGGCSGEWGFSEGSQPLGIFRPVHLILTEDIRIEPYGVHIWNDTSASIINADIYINTEIKNYGKKKRTVSIGQKMYDREGNLVIDISEECEIPAGQTKIIRQHRIPVTYPHLWSLEDPYLYSLKTEIRDQNKIIDNTTTSFGIRTISWPLYRNDGDHRFYLNGKPVFINGTAEYEHMIGNSHAFTDIQVTARAMQVYAAGFNAFRDAHQPHNLLYHHFWDSLGILYWPQMAAHIWFDNDTFKNNFKQLLCDWIKERRNSPSVILWGLENESTLPEWFARECTQIIREMDPTSPSQRLVTTCNGGTGTDWNVIQNWSGTYAGDLFAYDKDISREILNGEYGAWRSIDMHSEEGFRKDTPYSEERMCRIMETKILLAESVKDSCCGQFQWIFNSHDNPGRVQNGEGLRELDRVGPVNYKGLMTPWGELLDVYYLYRANYISCETEPMVYIVSHTWPDRWLVPGIKDKISVYSNCDEVELFNGVNNNSLGRKKKNMYGSHFIWEEVDIQYNVLYAVGYKNGYPVSEDKIYLHHLPEAPGYKLLFENNTNILQPAEGYHYIYRVNCGGPDFTDQNGSLWMADRHKNSDTTWGSLSWTDHYKGLPSFYASQRRSFDPVIGCDDWTLFQTFRYGREQLQFDFPLPDGEYMVELYFLESWYGNDGNMNCKGWRNFDVAFNELTVIEQLDIWKETGHDKPLKKLIRTAVTGGILSISFPKTRSGQAVISAIAIASKDQNVKPFQPSSLFIGELVAHEYGKKNQWKIQSWMDLGDNTYTDTTFTFAYLPSIFYGAEWIQPPHKAKSKNPVNAAFMIREEADIFIALDENIKTIPLWLTDYTHIQEKITTDENMGKDFHLYTKRFKKDSKVFLGPNGNTFGDASMYLVVVCPVNNLGQAPDQRPVTRYQAEEARIIGEGIIKKENNNKIYLEFSSETSCNIEWEFTVGLGDVYTLQFKYLNNSGDTIPMFMKITDIYGMTVSENIIRFAPRKGEWRTLNTGTGTSINAGRYKVSIALMEKAGLCIDAMDVQ